MVNPPPTHTDNNEKEVRGPLRTLIEALASAPFLSAPRRNGSTHTHGRQSGLRGAQTHRVPLRHRDYQKNYSSLLVGSDHAQLFDSGANRKEDITQVARKITDKPLSVLPSHLHVDHQGGLRNFQSMHLVACLGRPLLPLAAVVLVQQPMPHQVGGFMDDQRPAPLLRAAHRRHAGAMQAPGRGGVP